MSETRALRVFKAGDVVIRQGDPGDVAYLIIRGRAQVYRSTPSGDVVLHEMGPKRIFGEFALVTDSPRASNVRAIDDLECLVITRAILQAVLERADPLLQAIVYDYIAQLTA